MTTKCRHLIVFICISNKKKLQTIEEVLLNEIGTGFDFFGDILWLNQHIYFFDFIKIYLLKNSKICEYSSIKYTFS